MRSIAVLMVLVASAQAHASEGRIVEARGVVERISASGETVTLARGDRVRDGDLVRVADEGMARLLVDDHALIDLSPGAQLRVQAPQAAGSSSLSLVEGRLWARVAELAGGHSVAVETTNAVADVRGTSFFAEVDGESTTVSVEAGSVDVTGKNGGGHALIGAQESARVASGRLERNAIDHTALEALRARIASRERRFDGDSDNLERLRGSWRRAYEREGDGTVRERMREAIREAYRNRRDNPLDIDPGQARRILERLRELRERRRAARQ